MSRKLIPVVFSTDHNFVMPTAVAITSMLEASTDCHCAIHILQSSDVTDQDRSDLTEIAEKYGAEISFTTMGSEFEGLYEIRNVSTPTYYRLLIPWLFPQYDKVAYVDGDLIFNKSISKLIDAAERCEKESGSKEEFWLYGVNTPGFEKKEFLAHAKELGLDPAGYVNGGVLLFNTKRHRELGLDKRYKELMDKKFYYQDQDIVNIVCKGHIGLLPRDLNFSPYARRKERSAIEADPVIVHYSGPKPWQKLTFFGQEWWRVFEKTKYYDPRLARRIEFEALNPNYPPQYHLRQFLKLIIKK